ncbi:uncharacterized protein BP5553_01187 [Venustampulla echinocandica]|uniref:Uncharacterized protein n=1 Tax=Venustampulla echinocandica TaxID=2656787 RepID=A0A370U0A8_9HELO|nr:uncharacterized protein BP5553_01187 [Venustampulla echinocandica]RDL41208.1 hypothetical protein BP5553_01187 [Venustampulla echinocandica]
MTPMIIYPGTLLQLTTNRLSKPQFATPIAKENTNITNANNLAKKMSYGNMYGPRAGKMHETLFLRVEMAEYINSPVELKMTPPNARHATKLAESAVESDLLP